MSTNHADKEIILNKIIEDDEDEISAKTFWQKIKKKPTNHKKFLVQWERFVHKSFKNFKEKDA